MQIEFWASTLLLATISSAPAQRPVAVSAGNSISYAGESAKTQLEFRTREGARYIVSVERDSTVSPKVKPTDITIVGDATSS